MDCASEPPVAGAGGVGRRERLAWALVAVLAAGVPTFSILYFRTLSAEAPEMRLQVVTPPTTGAASMALSPDGSRLVFVALEQSETRLFLRPLNALTPEPLPGTEGAFHPFWSPDNRSLSFFAEGKLKRIGATLAQLFEDSVW